MDFPDTLRDEGARMEQEFFLLVRDAAVGKKKEILTPMKVTEEGKILLMKVRNIGAKCTYLA